MDVEDVPVGSLSEHPSNPRQSDVGAVADSIMQNGWYGTVVAQKSTRRILAGHGRVNAARHLGLESVPVFWVDVDDDRALRILLADNRTNDVASYDDQALADLLTDLSQGTERGLAGTGFDGAALDDLLADLLADDAKNNAGRDTEPGEPPAEPVTRPGDLWVLGDHRLFCGDATTDESYDALLGDSPVGLSLTDPPYANATDYAATDDTAEELDRLILGAVPAMRAVSKRVLLTPGVANIWRYPTPKWVLAWVEPAGVGSGPWGFCSWQPVLAYGGDPYLASGLGRRPDTYVGVGEGASASAHPVAKPLGVWEWLLERGSPDVGDRVLDPFAGSGTTAIACENLHRHARLIEIDAGYCDVICERWQRHTGRVPVRDGVEYDFVASSGAANPLA